MSARVEVAGAATGSSYEEHVLFYATNRRHVGDRWQPRRYGGEFSEDGAENLRFGRVELQLKPRRVKELLERETRFGKGDGEALAKHVRRQRGSARIQAFRERLVKERYESRQSDAKLGSQALFEEVRQVPLADRDVLVFIHGFNVGWWDAVASAMSLELMLNRNRERKVMVVPFTWPSDGKVIPYWSYFSDRSDARCSGYAVGRGFLKLRDFLVEQRQRSRTGTDEPCGRSIHLLCHSMGAYVLQNAVKRTLEFSTRGRPSRIFDQVFLCAPDVADDAFEPSQPFRQLPGLAENIAVYYNRGDLALPVSDYTKGNSDRLGWRGPNRPTELDRHVHAVDCSEVVKGFLEHNYHLGGLVNDDIAQSLDRVPPDDQRRNRRPVVNGWPNGWRLIDASAADDESDASRLARRQQDEQA